MRLASALGAAALLTTAAVTATWVNPYRWTGLGDLSRWSPFPLALALVLFAAAGLVAAGRIRRRAWRWTVRGVSVCAVPAAALSALAGTVGLMFWDGDTRVAAVSPDGRFELLVHQTSNMIDPVEGVYVQTRDGPFSRRAYLGCGNFDAMEPFIWMGFTGPDTVVVKSRTRQWTLRFDPVKVRAIDTLPEAMCGQGLYTG